MRGRRWMALLGLVLLVVCMTALGTTEAWASGVDKMTVDGVDVRTTPSGDGWSYDAATNIVTLENYVRELDYNGVQDIIFAKGMDLTICLKGENRIIINNAGLQEANVIYGTNNITITGDGSLEVTTPAHVEGNIWCGEKLTVQGGSLKLNHLYSESALIEGGRLVLYGAESQPALQVEGILQISGGMVYAKATTTFTQSINSMDLDISGGFIEATGGVDIMGDAVIRGGSVAVSGSVEPIGISAIGSIDIRGGSVAVSNTLEGISAIGSINISGGRTEIFNVEKGFVTVEDIEVTAGEVTVTSAEFDGLWAVGSIDIRGGSVAVSSARVGLDADSIGISGGEYRFSPESGACIAMYADSGNYRLSPDAVILADGFFAAATINGKQQLFPIQKIVSENEAQTTALDALYAQYGVENWDELLELPAFLLDKAATYVQSVPKVWGLSIYKTNDVDMSQGIELTVPVAGITAADDIVVFGLTEEGVLERMEAEAGDGVITGVFTSLSPIFVAKVIYAAPCVQVDGMDVARRARGDGYSYDAATNTLTLENYVRTYAADKSIGSIAASDAALTICIKGENRITIEGVTGETGAVDIIAGRNITITGDGSLAVTAPADGNARIVCTENLTVKSGSLKLNQLHAGSVLCIEGGALDISCPNAFGKGVLNSDGAVQISGGSIHIVAAESDAGILAGERVMLTDGGLTVTGAKLGISAGAGISISGGEYHYLPKEGAFAAVNASGGMYTLSPEARITADGFFAAATINGKQQLFPINKAVVWNQAQEATLNALYAQYGVENWDKLLEQPAFLLDKAALSVQSVSEVSLLDIHKVDGVDMSQGMELTAPVAGMTAADDVVVFHLTEEGVLEYIEAEAGDGVITGTFTSLSPVFVAKVTLEKQTDVPKDDESGDKSDDKKDIYSPEYYEQLKAEWTEMYAVADKQTAEGAAKSPKTGDTAMPAIAGMLALAVAGSIIAGGRRLHRL